MFFKPFTLPKEPAFQAYSVNILEIGALADGKNDIKPVIDMAMQKVSESGGGHILVPAGEYYCDGPIHFRSNVDLHLEKGAIIRFSNEYKKYLPVVFTRIEGIRCYNYSPLIYGIDLENVAVTGEGILDGNAFAWWDMMHAYMDKTGGVPGKELGEMVKKGVPVEERVFGTPEDALRPYFLQFVRCKNVWIEGVRFIHSPFWTVAPVFCENVIVRGISHKTEKRIGKHISNNTDTVNMDSCKNCLIEDVVVESSCDDNICVKSGRDQDGLETNVPTKNVLVQNCHFTNGGGVVVVGSETSGGIQNVCFRNITGIDCIRGIDVKGAIGRGNVIEDIDFENITIGRCRAGILVGFNRSHNGETDEIPIIRNISLENVSVEQSNVGAKFVGLPDFPVRNLHIKNVRVAGKDVGKIEYVEGLAIDNFHLETSEPVDVTLLGGHVIE